MSTAVAVLGTCIRVVAVVGSCSVLVCMGLELRHIIRQRTKRLITHPDDLVPGSLYRITFKEGSYPGNVNYEGMETRLTYVSGELKAQLHLNFRSLLGYGFSVRWMDVTKIVHERKG